MGTVIGPGIVIYVFKVRRVVVAAVAAHEHDSHIQNRTTKYIILNY